MLEEKKQKRLKGLCTAVSVISTLAKVCCILGVVGIIISMVVIPPVTANIKVEDNTLKVFGEKIKYERSEKEFKFTYKGETEKVDGKNEVFALNTVFDYLEEHNLSKVTMIVELTFACLTLLLLVLYVILTNLKKLVKNIRNGETPFTSENVGYIHVMGYLSIVVLVLPWITSLLLGLVFSSDFKTSFNITGITYILLTFIIMYVFEYGCKLQEKSKESIYSE